MTLAQMLLARPLRDFLSGRRAARVELLLNDRLVDLVEERIDLAVRITKLKDSGLIARRLATTPIDVCGAPEYFEAHGLPGWTVYPVLAVELVGGVCLLLGCRVRLAAVALLPVMLGALVPHAANGWMFTNTGGGWEYVAFLVIALAVQVLLGRGALDSRDATQRAADTAGAS